MKKILVVDDDEDIRETTGELLRLRGYEAVTVGRVDDVLRTMRATPPDLLLQDCHMPGLDLAALIGSMRSQPALRSVPVLLFTASIEAEGFWRAVGADGMIRKPFDADELESAIGRFLVKKTPTDAGPNRAGRLATTVGAHTQPRR